MTAGGAFEILDWRTTPLGVLCLRRRELLSQPGTTVTEVTLDGEFLMSSYHTDSERALASRAIEWHGGGDDLRVLVGGLGLGYTAHEALAAPSVCEVEVVERLGAVIDWLDQGLLPLAPALQAADHLRVVDGDIFARLLGPRADARPWDVVAIDVDHSPDELLDPRHRPFYTADGLRLARAHLGPSGVLAIWSSADSDAFEAQLRKVFDEVRRDVIAWHNELIDRDQEDVLFLAR